MAPEFRPGDVRLADLKQRHPEYAVSIEAARRPARALEAQVAEAIDVRVDELVDRLRAAWESGS